MHGLFPGTTLNLSMHSRLNVTLKCNCADAQAHALTATSEHVLLRRSISLGSGTERAFSGSTVNGFPHDNKAPGVYVGAVGGLPLFSSDTKFDSGALLKPRMSWD